MNYKLVIVNFRYDDRQQSASDFAEQVLLLLQNSGYYVVGVNDTVIVQATYIAGIFYNGQEQISALIGTYSTDMSDSTIGAAVAALVIGIPVYTSSTPLELISVACTDAPAPAAGAGAPNPSAEPSPGNP
jgi:hypothetical protein